jgi:hypothetical protein
MRPLAGNGGRPGTSRGKPARPWQRACFAAPTFASTDASAAGSDARGLAATFVVGRASLSAWLDVPPVCGAAAGVSAALGAAVRETERVRRGAGALMPARAGLVASANASRSVRAGALGRGAGDAARLPRRDSRADGASAALTSPSRLGVAERMRWLRRSACAGSAAAKAAVSALSCDVSAAPLAAPPSAVAASSAASPSCGASSLAMPAAAPSTTVAALSCEPGTASAAASAMPLEATLPTGGHGAPCSLAQSLG